MSRLTAADPLHTLQRQQARLLWGGGLVMSTLIVLLLVIAVIGLVREDLERPKDELVARSSLIDQMMARRERGYARTLASIQLLLNRSSSALRDQGQAIRTHSLHNGEEGQIHQDGGVVWRVWQRPLKTDAQDYALVLGLVHEASQLARQGSAEMRQPGSLNALIYTPAGDFFAATPALRRTLREPSADQLKQLSAHLTADPQGRMALVHTYLRSSPLDGRLWLIGQLNIVYQGRHLASLLELDDPLSVDEIVQSTGAAGLSLVDSQRKVLRGGSNQPIPAGLLARAQASPSDVVRQWTGGQWVYVRWLPYLDAAMVCTRSPSQVFSSIGATLTALLVGAALSLVMIVVIARRLHTRVLAPAWKQAETVAVSGHLGRMAVATSPFPLALLDPRTQQVVHASQSYLSAIAPQISPEDLLTLVQHHDLSLQDFTHAKPIAFEVSWPPGGREPKHYSLAATWVNMGDQPLVLISAYDLTAQFALAAEHTRARSLAEQHSAAKTAFVAHVSHEIRTPLHAIMGQLELMAYEPLPALLADRLSQVRMAADSLAALLGGVLDLTKAQAGMLQLHPAPADIVDTAESVMRQLAPLAEAKGLTFDALISPDLSGTWITDAQRVGQVLMNLVGNALKFTPHGFVRLVMDVEMDEERHCLILEVEDSGPGIPLELQEKVLEPYAQARPQDVGTGLGLPLVHELCALAGGSLVVQTPSTGFGLCVRVRWPIVQGCAPAAAKLQGKIAVLSDTPALALEIERWSSHWGLESTHVPTDPAPEFMGWEHWIVVPCEEDAASVPPWVLARPQTLVLSAHASIQAQPGPPWRLSAFARSRLYQLLGGQKPSTATTAPELAPRPALHVLVVDDHPANRRLLEEQLAVLGHTFEEAADGRQALEVFARAVFDCIVTDLAMPGMDGVTLAAQLRAQGVSIPILGVTANVATQEHQRAYEAGMTQILVKPVGLTQLASALPDSQVPGDWRAGAHTISNSVMEAFVQATCTYQTQLQEAVSRHDRAEIVRLVHLIKGGLWLMGETDVADKFQHCEDIGQSSSMDELSRNVNQAVGFLGPVMDAVAVRIKSSLGEPTEPRA